MKTREESILRELGTSKEDIPILLEYTKNKFILNDPLETYEEDYLEKWKDILNCYEQNGAEMAMNKFLVPKGLSLHLEEEKDVLLEIYHSVAGDILIFYVKNINDFVTILKYIVHKGKDIANIDKIGAIFASGKKNRFIVLSNKSYSNITADELGLEDTIWKEKSMIIRREHECTHYYTKRFFHSSKNNLHDELIADFNGLYEAFGEYRADYFLKFMGMDKEQGEGRFQVYTNELSKPAAAIVRKIGIKYAEQLEKWSKTEDFSTKIREEKIQYLCKKGLLDFYDL